MTSSSKYLLQTQLNDEDEPIEWEATPPPESGPIEAEV